MATRDDIYTAIRNADKAGDSDSVRKLSAYLQTMDAAPPPAATVPAAAQPAARTVPAGPTSGAFGNLFESPEVAAARRSRENDVSAKNRAEIGGFARGGRDILDTLAELAAKGYDKVTGGDQKSLSSLVTGQPQGQYAKVKAADDAAKAEFLRANPEGSSARDLRVLGNAVATAPVGGVIARGAAAIPGVARAAPNMLNAIRTSGMTAGAANPLANIATRAAGGAITGGASAGLVDPSQAGAGATFGAALPVATKVAGEAGNALRNLVRGPQQSPELAAAVQAARGAGYVVPPTQASPTLANRVLEGAAGKISTAQNASAKNQAVTNAKGATALGLPADTKLTPDVLKSVRDTAGEAYKAIGATGMITPGAAYAKALDDIAQPYRLTAGAFPGAKPSPVIELVDSLRSPAFASASAVEKIKQLRTAADDAFRSGNTDVGRAAKSAAKALEDAVEEHLQVIGQPQALKEFRDARELIAKTYSVEKAMNPSTGTVDAKKLAGQLARGKPLSGELKQVAEFAGRFPKAAQTIESMGSLPQTSPLDWAAGAGLSAATSNPLALASVALRPGARALALSPLVQNRLTQSPGSMNQLQALLANQEAQQLGYRAAPVALAAGR